MSSLDKLAIRGIRSFDQNEISVIQFFTPLTVIVGHNGSGKTTIIECLKYATTGDLPPNTKGGAFVHDPSIAGTSEVKASVKLRFINSRKEKMVVERRLQVTKKKGATATGLTMKTLEGTISFADGAEGKSKQARTSLSTKCASLDEEVPKQLGVSKAILENVIFCHQEESNWPLSEPAALKKKFDDIFEATKYTKALDQIKTLRKEQTQEIKVDKEKLTALHTDRNRATKLKTTIDKLSTTIDSKKGEHATLEEDIVQIVKENQAFFQQASRYSEIIQKASTFRTQKSIIEENRNQLRSSLKELKDGDAELKKRIEGFEGELVEKKNGREETKQKRDDEVDRLQGVEGKRSQQQMNLGRLQADKNRFEDTLARRQTLVKELAEKHKFAGYDHELTHQEMTDFAKKLEDAAQKQQKDIMALKAEAREKETEKQKLIQGLASAQAADERAKRTVGEQIREANHRISKVNRSLEDCTTTDADISYKQSNFEDSKKRKAELEATIETANYPGRLQTLNKELKEMEESKEKLLGELSSLNTQADVRAKLGLKRKDVETKDQAITTMLNKSTDQYRTFIKSDPTRETMESALNAELKVANDELSAKESTARNAMKDLQSIESSVTFAKKKLKDVKDEIAATRTKITKSLSEMDTEHKTVEPAIQEAEGEVENCNDELNELTNSAKFYITLGKNGKTKKRCMGCNRGLEKGEMAAFEEWCRERSSENPAKIESAKSDLKLWSDQLASLRRLLPTEVALKKLETEALPAADKEVEAAKAKISGAASKSSEATDAVTKLKGRIGEIEYLKKTATEIVRMNREVIDLQREIVRLESELSATGSTATADDIQKEVSTFSDKIRQAKLSTDQLRVEQQKQNATLQSLANNIHSAEMELSRKKQELREKENLEKQKEAERTEIIRLEGQLKELSEKIKGAATPIQTHQDQLRELQSHYADREMTESRQLQAFNKSLEQLDTNLQDIKGYHARGGDAALTSCEKEVEQLDKVIREIKAKLTELQNALSQADKELADSTAIMRNMQDNVRLRKAIKEIEAIEASINDLDEDNAKKSYRKFDEEYNVKRRKQSDMQASQARLGGEIETLKSDLDQKKKEMLDEYKDIENRYKTELIKVKTAEVANQDLEKYGKALDSAIMSFHGHKMKEINDTIAELWTKTYQGTDIDKIMIKSDAEGKGAGGRSYNYRVVMFKDNTEMDMRGRCSAGQKVLACIIIRLALADSFSINCGILALDEPTTNLDKANIDSLGAALAELIKERRLQSNFQIIVITHDEDFLTVLGASGSLDKFWRVVRSSGGLTSTIVKERLT